MSYGRLARVGSDGHQSGHGDGHPLCPSFVHDVRRHADLLLGWRKQPWKCDIANRKIPSLISLTVSVDAKHHVYLQKAQMKNLNLEQVGDPQATARCLLFTKRKENIDGTFVMLRWLYSCIVPQNFDRPIFWPFFKVLSYFWFTFFKLYF